MTKYNLTPSFAKLFKSFETFFGSNKHYLSFWFWAERRLLMLQPSIKFLLKSNHKLMLQWQNLSGWLFFIIRSKGWNWACRSCIVGWGGVLIGVRVAGFMGSNPINWRWVAQAASSLSLGSITGSGWVAKVRLGYKHCCSVDLFFSRQNLRLLTSTWLFRKAEEEIPYACWEILMLIFPKLSFWSVKDWNEEAWEFKWKDQTRMNENMLYWYPNIW